MITCKSSTFRNISEQQNHRWTIPGLFSSSPISCQCSCFIWPPTGLFAHVKPPKEAASTRSIWHKPCTRVTLIPALKCQGKQRSETWRYMAKLYHHYHPNWRQNRGLQENISRIVGAWWQALQGGLPQLGAWLWRLRASSFKMFGTTLWTSAAITHRPTRMTLFPKELRSLWEVSSSFEKTKQFLTDRSVFAKDGGKLLWQSSSAQIARGDSAPKRLTQDSQCRRQASCRSEQNPRHCCWHRSTSVPPKVSTVSTIKS